MRFLVLACDYDGTIATHGRVDDATVKALHRCLESGRKLVLVTGRELPELIEIFPDICLFEWVVAENGGLLYRPATREEIPLGPPPAPEFIAELQRRGVKPFSIGRAIVATWQPFETIVLRTIRDLGLELQVIFNKGAVMVLPSGINKATGLHKALREMGISRHNVVAVGDAENDHALLASCEAGAAVANAVATLKEHADLVTSADHGAGVQELVVRLVENDLAELSTKLTRHHLVLGRTANGDEFSLPPYGGNLLIAGSSGGGKSTVATALFERLADKGYQVCIIDPEGDYGEIEEAVSIGTPQQAPDIDAILKLLETPTQCVVVNLLAVTMQDRPAMFHSLLGRLQNLRARHGRPHWIVVDEAHHVCPPNWARGEAQTPQSLDRTVFITLEPGLLPVAALASVEQVIAIGKAPGKTLSDFAAAVGLSPPTVTVELLEPGQVVAWRPSSGADPVIVSVEPTRNERRRHIRKYAEGELEPDRSFYFRGVDEKLNLRAQNLMVFLQLAEGIDDETWRHHLRAGDYSRWFRDAIKDLELAAEAVEIERDAQLAPAEARDRIRHIVEARYALFGHDRYTGFPADGIVRGARKTVELTANRPHILTADFIEFLAFHG